jgi:hypothetical protein
MQPRRQRLIRFIRVPLVVYCQQALLHEVLDFVRQMRETPPEESPQMGAQPLQKIPIGSLIPAESEQEKAA